MSSLSCLEVVEENDSLNLMTTFCYSTTVGRQQYSTFTKPCSQLKLTVEWLLLHLYQNATV